MALLILFFSLKGFNCSYLPSQEKEEKRFVTLGFSSNDVSALLAQQSAWQ